MARPSKAACGHDHKTYFESAISGFGAASHDHNHGGDVEQEQGFLSRLANKIKSVDGIDETANLAGQILPGIAAPIAVATILVAATPFVWLGVLGMKEEYKTACEEFDEISTRRIAIENKISEMMSFAQKKREILQQKFGLEIPENSQEVPQKGSMLGVAYYAAEYQSLRNKELIAALGKKFGWTGLVGMSGMFAGMLPATAAAGLEIANEISANVALESAALALEMAAGSCFLVGQVAMSAYAINRGNQGLKAKEILLKSKEIFESNCSKYLSENSSRNVNEIIDQQIRFNQKHSIEYGALTTAGQGFMIAGTILGMTGIGLVATVPMFGIGAPLTIGGALQRIYYQEKEKSFRGKNSEFTDEKISEISPISLFTKFFRSASGDDLDKKVLGELDEKFCELTDNLAKVKSWSLLHQMVNCTKDRERKIAFLKEAAKKTGLEKVVLEKVKDFYQNNEEQFKSFLDLSAQEANCKIAKGILTVLDTSAAKLGFEEEVPDQEMSKLASRKLITAAKNSLKSARFFAADAIVRVGQTIQARKDLELTPEEIAPSNNKTPFAQDASHYHDGKACEGDHEETFLETQFCAPVPKKNRS